MLDMSCTVMNNFVMYETRCKDKEPHKTKKTNCIERVLNTLGNKWFIPVVPKLGFAVPRGRGYLHLQFVVPMVVLHT